MTCARIIQNFSNFIFVRKVNVMYIYIHLHIIELPQGPSIPYQQTFDMSLISSSTEIMILCFNLTMSPEVE